MRFRIADFGLRIEEGGCLAADSRAARRPSAFRLPPSALRPGMTLVELLVTIMIIAILASLVLGVAALAGQTAREAKTRMMVSRLHTLLMEQYETYKTRRIALRESTDSSIVGIEDQIDARYPLDGGPGNAARRVAARAEARLYARRELMLMEMPDRWSDVLLAAVPATPQGKDVDARAPFFLENRGSPLDTTAQVNRTPLMQLYLRQYDRMVRAINKITNVKNTRQDIIANQSAECLYMIVMLATGDGEAPSLFNEDDIGDTDGDGAQEFLDGWGHPIRFLRWAPSFRSQIQLNVPTFGVNVVDNVSPSAPVLATWRVAASGDHDPFDIFRVDPYAFRLVPLVYSAGRDEELGIVTGYDTSGNLTDEDAVTATWSPLLSTTITPSNTSPLIRDPQLTPYILTTNGTPKLSPIARYGSEILNTTTSIDNITNHLIGER